MTAETDIPMPSGVPRVYEAPDGARWFYTPGLDLWSAGDRYLTTAELRAAFPDADV